MRNHPDQRWHPAPSHVTLVQTSKLGQERIDRMQQQSMTAGSSTLARVVLALMLLGVLAVIAIITDLI